MENALKILQNTKIEENLTYLSSNFEYLVPNIIRLTQYETNTFTKHNYLNNLNAG